MGNASDSTLNSVSLTEGFEFRTIRYGEETQAVNIEQTCFPPHEACSDHHMRERIDVAADLFLAAVDRKNGEIAGFLNGIATDEEDFRDAFFTEASLHKVEGKNIMLLGLDVLPAYRGKGLAHEIVRRYADREKARGREKLILTCLEEKVTFYEGMGFRDIGISASSWGGEAWHEMSLELN